MIKEIKFGKYLVKEIPPDKLYLLSDITTYMDKYELTTLTYHEWESRYEVGRW